MHSLRKGLVAGRVHVKVTLVMERLRLDGPRRARSNVGVISRYCRRAGAIHGGQKARTQMRGCAATSDQLRCLVEGDDLLSRNKCRSRQQYRRPLTLALAPAWVAPVTLAQLYGAAPSLTRALQKNKQFLDILSKYFSNLFSQW